uniref:Uncharacterized protein n=1 Tax=Arundo donax TaxID=35708 RepID=A0A0A8Y3I4_ARUDO
MQFQYRTNNVRQKRTNNVREGNAFCHSGGLRSTNNLFRTHMSYLQYEKDTIQ